MYPDAIASGLFNTDIKKWGKSLYKKWVWQ
jgi:hypothetical protein